MLEHVYVLGWYGQIIGKEKGAVKPLFLLFALTLELTNVGVGFAVTDAGDSALAGADGASYASNSTALL